MSQADIFDGLESGVEDSVLTELATLCTKQQLLEQEVIMAEERLKEKKKELENVSRNLIPSILNSTGLSEVRLSTGEKLQVQDKVMSSIVDKNYTLAYRNMINAEGGDDRATELIDSLFKSQVVIDQISDEVLDILLDHNIPYDSKRSIHHQTLNKYCRDRLASGKAIPEGISVFQYQETRITK